MSDDKIQSLKMNPYLYWALFVINSIGIAESIADKNWIMFFITAPAVIILIHHKKIRPF
jgi:hypothetical protein